MNYKMIYAYQEQSGMLVVVQKLKKTPKLKQKVIISSLISYLTSESTLYLE